MTTLHRAALVSLLCDAAASRWFGEDARFKSEFTLRGLFSQAADLIDVLTSERDDLNAIITARRDVPRP